MPTPGGPTDHTNRNARHLERKPKQRDQRRQRPRKLPPNYRIIHRTLGCRDPSLDGNIRGIPGCDRNFFRKAPAWICPRSRAVSGTAVLTTRRTMEVMAPLLIVLRRTHAPTTAETLKSTIVQRLQLSAADADAAPRRSIR
jgi:hypothetical protein